MPSLPNLAPYAFYAAVAVGFVAAWLKRLEDRKQREAEERFERTLRAIPESWYENERK
jgi:ABC-type arginine transport system permease subunit